MGTAKVVIKYGLYLFIAVWMFALGVMVGRGTSPVTFDTESFQDRLETIAREFGKDETPEAPVDLEFYDALNSPVRHEVKGGRKKTAEIVPAKPDSTKSAASKPDGTSTQGVADVPVKMSKKQATFNRAEVSAKRKAVPTPKPAKPAIKTASATKPKEKRAKEPAVTGGYTIQVAAYKDMKDAITQIAVLEKKGFPAYRVQAKRSDGVWYRVRTGVFTDYASAATGLKKLKQAKINGMIIKKDE